MPRQQVLLRNDLSEISRLTEIIEAFGEEEGIGPKDVFAITLALDELITNVISYAYEDEAPHEIQVTLERKGDEIAIEIEDDGRSFDPTKAPEPEVDVPVEHRRIGGLGIHFVKKMMARFDYERNGDRNIVRLRKKLGL